jgi:hypothetical protein
MVPSRFPQRRSGHPWQALVPDPMLANENGDPARHTGGAELWARRWRTCWAIAGSCRSCRRTHCAKSAIGAGVRRPTCHRRGGSPGAARGRQPRAARAPAFSHRSSSAACVSVGRNGGFWRSPGELRPAVYHSTDVSGRASPAFERRTSRTKSFLTPKLNVLVVRESAAPTRAARGEMGDAFEWEKQEYLRGGTRTAG